MRYLSTFTGIGGFELGIQLAYEKLCIKNKEQRLQGAGDTEGLNSQRNNLSEHGLTCIGYSEIDKYATQIYQKHFPTHHNYGDITKIVAEELPDFDLLVGGFPCQAFSIAGKRGGFEDARGTMFFELARILRAKQPRLFLFENVKGLLSHDDGRTFKTIIATIDELGYDCQWQVCNSKNHGVPQNRERVFIVGHLRGTARSEVFPIRVSDEKDTQSGGLYEGDKRRFSSCEARSEKVEYTGDSRNKKERKGTLSRDKSCTDGRPSLIDVSYPSRTRVYKDNAPTVRDYGSGGNKMPMVNGIRRLTPVECERLQGFPDQWTAGLSDTQRYKTLGNAVTVNVIRDIMHRILVP